MIRNRVEILGVMKEVASCSKGQTVDYRERGRGWS